MDRNHTHTHTHTHTHKKALVLVDENWGIGCDGGQNIFLKDDLQRFVQFTRGNTVILGRVTLATFPQGKPLKHRRNLILSRQKHLEIPGGEVFHSAQELVKAILPEEEVFVIGGAMVYEEFLPFCSHAFVTKVDKKLPADAFFPNLDSLSHWALQETIPQEEEGISYSYCTYTNSHIQTMI